MVRTSLALFSVFLSVGLIPQVSAGCLSASIVRRYQCGVPNQFQTYVRLSSHCSCSGNATINLENGGSAIISNLNPDEDQETIISPCGPNEATYESAQLSCVSSTGAAPSKGPPAGVALKPSLQSSNLRALLDKEKQSSASNDAKEAAARQQLEQAKQADSNALAAQTAEENRRKRVQRPADDELPVYELDTEECEGNAGMPRTMRLDSPTRCYHHRIR